MPDESQWQQLIPVAVMMAVLVALFWWIIVRPAQMRQRKHIELIDNLKAGDRVVTVGGIYGTIVRVGEKSMKVDVGDVVLTMDRRAVRRLQSQEDL